MEETEITTEIKKLFSVNPMAKYVKRAEEQAERYGQKLNPVHELVNYYYNLQNMEGKPKKFYEGKNGYGKLAREAKKLLESCGQSLEDSLWSLDKMKYLANKKGFNWSISTCLKHNLQWGK